MMTVDLQVEAYSRNKLIDHWEVGEVLNPTTSTLDIGGKQAILSEFYKLPTITGLLCDVSSCWSALV